MTRIENWSVVDRGDYPENRRREPLPSEFSTFTSTKTIRLYGNIYDHPRVDDGDKALTTRIVKVDGEEVYTRSGSAYQLGKPNPEWVRWVLANE